MPCQTARIRASRGPDAARPANDDARGMEVYDGIGDNLKALRSMRRSPVTAGTPHLRHCYENRRATPHPSFPRRREPIPALGLWTKRRGQQHPFSYPYVACARPQCFPRRRESTPGMVRHHDTGSSPSRRPSHSSRESRTGPCVRQDMRAILYSWQTTRRRMD